MASLFGIGQQQERKERPWDVRSREAAEREPFAKLLEESGDEQGAALARANLKPEEKGILAKILGSRAGSGSANTLLDNMLNAKSQEELDKSAGQAREAALSLPAQEANVRLKAIESQAKAQTAAIKKLDTSRNIQSLAEGMFKDIEAAPKSFWLNNISESLVGSNSPEVAALKSKISALVGILRNAEGGGQIGVNMLSEILERAGGNIGSWIGTDPNTLMAQISGALEAGGFGEEAKRAREAFEAGRANNMEASGNALQTPRPSLGRIDSPLGGGMVNLALDTLNGAAHVGANILGLDSKFSGLPEVERTPENVAWENVLGAATFVAGGIATGGVASAAAIAGGAAGGLAAYGVGFLGAKAGEVVADATTKTPRTEEEANRARNYKETLSTIGGLLSLGMATNVVRNRAIAAGGKPPISPASEPAARGGASTAKQPRTINVEAVNKPSGQTVQPQQPQSPVASSLDTLSKKSQAAGLIAGQFKAQSPPTGLQLANTHNAVSKLAVESITGLQALSRDVAEQARGTDVGGSLEVAQGMLSRQAASIEEGVSLLSKKKQAVEVAKAAVYEARMSPELYEGAIQGLSQARADYTNAVAGLANRIATTDSISRQIASVSQANPVSGQLPTYKDMINRLNVSIATGNAPIAYDAAAANTVLLESTQNPVAMKRFEGLSPADRLRHNMAIETYRANMEEAREAASDKYAKQLQAQDKKAYEVDKKAKDKHNKAIEERNVRAIDSVIEAALPLSKNKSTDVDLANTLSERLNKMYSEEMKPISKMYADVETLMKNLRVPQGAKMWLVKEADAIRSDFDSILTSEVTAKTGKLLSNIRDGIVNDKLHTMGQLHKAIKEANQIADFELPEGQPKSKLKAVVGLLKEGLDRALADLEGNAKTKGKAQMVRSSLEAANKAYAAVKARLSSGPMIRMRSPKTESKVEAMRALSRDSEQMARVLKATGNGYEYQAMLADRLKAELTPFAKAGDNAGLQGAVSMWDNKTAEAMPKGVISTLKGISLEEPVPVGEYRPSNYAGAEPPLKDWFKQPPRGTLPQEMTAEQLWGYLDKVDNVREMKATTVDSEARRVLFADKAAEVLSRQKTEGDTTPWSMHKAKHLSGGMLDIRFKNPLEEIVRWDEALKLPEKRNLVRELIGEDKLEGLERNVREAVRETKLIRGAGKVKKYTGFSAATSTLFHGAIAPPLAILSAVLAVVELSQKAKVREKLAKRGIEYKSKRGGKDGKKV